MQRERGGSSDVWWKTVPPSTDERLQQETLCHRQWTDDRVRRTSRDVDESIEWIWSYNGRHFRSRWWTVRRQKCSELHNKIQNTYGDHKSGRSSIWRRTCGAKMAAESSRGTACFTTRPLMIRLSELRLYTDILTKNECTMDRELAESDAAAYARGRRCVCTTDGSTFCLVEPCAFSWNGH